MWRAAVSNARLLRAGFERAAPNDGTVGVLPATLASLAASFVLSSNTFFPATIEAQIVPTRLDETNSFFAPVVQAGIAPARLDATATFYAASVEFDPLLPARLDETNSFFAPTMGAGLLPTTLAADNTFYSATTGSGLLAALVPEANSFYAADIEPGAVALDVPLLVEATTFFRPKVGTFDVRTYQRQVTVLDAPAVEVVRTVPAVMVAHTQPHITCVVTT